VAGDDGGRVGAGDGEFNTLYTARFADTISVCRSLANKSTGVMRFLQTEWHRHERDRNSWEIERGEMKSRIATLEGEAKKSKPTHDALSKHIKMLELALRKEREKVKSLSKGEEVDMKDAKELAREQLKAAGKGMLITLI
jgi:nitric oxide reductase activation protein